MMAVARTRAMVLAALLLSCAAAARGAAPARPPPCPSDAASPDPARLLQRVEQALEGRSSAGTLSMRITTSSWTRSLKLKFWSKGEGLALLRILDGGPREIGMMTLKRDKQLWNYLPQAGRVMKLPAGMLGDSWMGSDFTNDDLVNGSSLVDDFTTRVDGLATHEGRAAWRVVLTPRPGAAIVWGQVEMLVERATCVPLVNRFFDEDGKLARTMTYSDLRTVGWRQFPARVVVTPADAARTTVVSYDEIQFDLELPDDMFSLHRLQQGR